MITYLKRDKIDIQKWDHTIAHAINGELYAYSWYLDIVCEGQWDALVTEDYKWLMPLPWRKRMGLQYIYQPFCTPQLGVFGSELPDADSLKAFMDAIPKSFRLIDQKVNATHAAFIDEATSNHISYHLDLNRTYEAIQKSYNTHTRRSLRKAKKHSLHIRKDMKPSEVLTLFRENKGRELSNISEHDYSLLLAVLKKSTLLLTCDSVGVFNTSGDCLAAACFVFSHKKVYFLLSAISEEGKEKRAMYYLLDDFFSQHHSQACTFDFEGSDIPGLARFYSGFGANPVVYKRVYTNRLPAIIKWLK